MSIVTDHRPANWSRRKMLAATAFAVAAPGIGALTCPASAQISQTLRVGIVPVDSTAEIVFARETGIFQRAGITVNLQAIQGGSAIAAAVAAGSLEIGWSAVDVLGLLHTRGIPIVIIAPAAEYLGAPSQKTIGLIVATTSPIQTARDLNGKTVGTNALRSFGETNVKAWVDKNGGDSTTVKFLELPMVTIPGAVDSGRIDAGVLLEPFLSAGASNHRVLFYGYAIASPFLSSAYFTTRHWATDNPSLVKRFAESIREAGAWAEKNRAASDAIIARFTKIPLNTVTRMAHSSYGKNLAPALLQPVIDVSAKYAGYAPFPAQELL